LALISACLGLFGCAPHTIIDLLPDAGQGAGGTSPEGGSAAGTGGGTDAAPDGDAATDAALPTSLIHRYSFSEPGTVAYDSVGAAHGELFQGARIPTGGDVVLDGVDDYVWLPDGIVSSLQSATLMIWAIWRGGPAWQRLWDFGSSRTVRVADVPTQQAYRTFFLTPLPAGGVPGPLAMLEFHGELRGTAFGDEYLDVGSPDWIVPEVGYHYAVVIDEDSQMMSLYIDGEWIGARTLEVKGTGVYFLLSDLDDNNNSIGRSQYASDRYLAAEILEFRIYDRALGPEEVAAVTANGAEVVSLTPPDP
jgi:hypothetical protein